MYGAQRQLDVLANNLANVSTTGYKRDELAFGDTFEVTLRANGGQGAEIGKLSLTTALDKPYTSFAAGQAQNTGNPLDFAIDGDEGMFAVQTERGIRYTRNGSFELTADGQLVTREKYPVLDDRMQPIQIPVGDFEARPDGSLTVDEEIVAKIGVFKGSFAKQGENLFSATNAVAIEEPTVRWQAIEGSNVNAVESMVNMIQLQRRFDLAQRSILQQDELSQRLIQSLSQP